MSAVRFRLVVGVALAAGGALAVACGLDAVGSADPAQSMDASTAAVGDGSTPSACATIDAACLGVLPDIWKPVAIGAPSCGPGFGGTTLVANPRLGSDSCACGACQAIGAFTCTGVVEISGGDGCNDDPIANAPPSTCTKASAEHLRGLAPRGSGTISCFAPNDAGSGATTDALTVCVPSCEADFCGSASRCVMADGDHACPGGFTLKAHAGTAADPGCPPCACTPVAAGSCTGTVTAYANDNCGASGKMTTYALGTCNVFDDGYDSVLAKLVPPDASCTPVATAPPVGDASLVSAKTICCQ